METQEYKFKGRKGIDDLLSIYAFMGNSQGDESVSNETSDYIAAKGWMGYIFGDDIDKTDQQAIYKESERRKQANIEYIDKLHKEGRFKEEYEISIELVHNPIFDDNAVLLVNKDNPLSSSKIIFLDLNKKDES